DGAAEASEPLKAMTLLVDTSASRALGYAKYVASVRSLIKHVKEHYGNIALDVLAFDQDHELVFSGKASERGDAQDQKLADRRAAGASDLAQALAAVGGKVKGRRVVVVTDGVITAGAEHADLAARVKQLDAERVDVVLAGGIRDDKAATEL